MKALVKDNCTESAKDITNLEAEQNCDNVDEKYANEKKEKSPIDINKNGAKPRDDNLEEQQTNANNVDTKNDSQSENESEILESESCSNDEVSTEDSCEEGKKDK